MQDRYAGDIGDFGKLGFLKFIEKEKLKVGVNWYLTEPVTKVESRNKDGKHRVAEKYKVCDAVLFEKLEKVFIKKRSVTSIEEQKPLKSRYFYHEKVDAFEREIWHKKALKKLKHCDVVFLDPDNGLEVVSAKGKKLTKYVLLDELRSYINNGQSVVFYNHRSRKQVGDYFIDIYKKLEKITMIKPFSISFHKGTIRDYIILANTKHETKLRDACTKMLESVWGPKTMKLCQKDNSD